jgi:hypothetical protein
MHNGSSMSAIGGFLGHDRTVCDYVAARPYSAARRRTIEPVAVGTDNPPPTPPAWGRNRVSAPS